MYITNKKLRFKNNMLLRYFTLYILYFTLSSFTFFAAPHKFYTSITSIDYNAKQNSAEIIMNVFVDDLEVSLSKFHKTKIKIDEKNINAKTLETQVSQYLLQNLIISKNNKTLENKLIGIEYNKKDMVTIYVEIEKLKTLNGLTLQNTMLFKDFEEQVNMVNIKEGDKKQSLVFNKSNQKLEIKFIF